VTAIGAIWRRELVAYFASPVAYAVLAGFLILSGAVFDSLISTYLRYEGDVQRASQLLQTPPPINVNELVLRNYFAFVAQILPFLFLPVITMRLLSEEKRQGTMELLLTTPITDVQIVVGKYLAALSMYVVLLITTALHVGFVFAWGNPDPGPVVAGYAGLFMIGAAYLAVGMFISSLTESQIVAAVSTASVNLLFLVVGFAAALVQDPHVAAVLEYVSVSAHFADFEKGVLDTRALLFFASFAFFGVFLTLRSVESLRWKG
jgi:ABC-2 type transport system permease protein